MHQQEIMRIWREHLTELGLQPWQVDVFMRNHKHAELLEGYLIERERFYRELSGGEGR